MYGANRLEQALGKKYLTIIISHEVALVIMFTFDLIHLKTVRQTFSTNIDQMDELIPTKRFIDQLIELRILGIM